MQTGASLLLCIERAAKRQRCIAIYRRLTQYVERPVFYTSQAALGRRRLALDRRSRALCRRKRKVQVQGGKPSRKLERHDRQMPMDPITAQ